MQFKTVKRLYPTLFIEINGIEYEIEFLMNLCLHIREYEECTHEYALNIYKKYETNYYIESDLDKNVIIKPYDSDVINEENIAIFIDLGIVGIIEHDYEECEPKEYYFKNKKELDNFFYNLETIYNRNYDFLCQEGEVVE